MSSPVSVVNSGKVVKRELFALEDPSYYFNRKPKSKTAIGPLKDEVGSLVTSVLVKANMFARFFSSVFKEDNECFSLFQSADVGILRMLEGVKKLSDRFSHIPDDCRRIFLTKLRFLFVVL